MIRFAILGVDRAGASRAKAIRRDPRSEIVAVHGGPLAQGVGVPVTATPEEAIDLAHVVCVCSPDDQHAMHVRMALDRKRHVIVDHPLGATEAEVRDLLALAARNGRVLHVAHVDLLGAAATTLAGNLHGFSIRRIAATVQTHGEEVPGETLPTAPELLRIADFAGPFARVDDVRPSPGRLLAWLTTAGGAAVELTIEQGPYFAPWRYLEIAGLQGTWVLEGQLLSRDRAPQTLLEASSPFERDHVAALRRMLHGEPSYLTEERILHAQRVADQVAARRIGPISPG